jgi:hypothetical protein
MAKYKGMINYRRVSGTTRKLYTSRRGMDVSNPLVTAVMITGKSRVRYPLGARGDTLFRGTNLSTA